MLRIAARALPAVALTLVAVGCASSAGSEGPLATYRAGANRAGDDALMTGTLGLDDGCVVLDDGTVPVFPENEAAWDGLELVWRGQTYAIGASLSLPGGEAGPDAALPEACGDRQAWIVAPE